MKTVINNKRFMPRAGEVWLVDLPNAIGHQQGGIRPVLITSNNVGNYYSPVFEGVSLTSKKQENSQPTHAFYRAGEAGLKDDSVLLAEQKWTINKSQLIKKIGVMNDDQLLRAVTAIAHANPIYLLAYEAGVQNTPTFKRLAMAQ